MNSSTFRANITFLLCPPILLIHTPPLPLYVVFKRLDTVLYESAFTSFFQQFLAVQEVLSQPQC